MARRQPCKYNRWSKEELIAAIEGRTGEIVASQQRQKAAYIERLKKLDREPGVFRFLDLPAELRNHVYEELLTNQSGKDDACIAYPSILRTCKTIYGEAASMFHAADIHANLVISMASRDETVSLSFPAGGKQFRIELRNWDDPLTQLRLRLHLVKNVIVTIVYDYWTHPTACMLHEETEFLKTLPSVVDDLHMLKVVFTAP